MIRVPLQGALLLGVSALSGSLVLGAEDLETLPPTTVLANRIATPLPLSGSAVTILEGEDLDQSQFHHLEEALRRVPGVFSESTGGQRGSVSSLFLRGLKTAHTHIQVDGIRLSDSTIVTNNFLGNAGLLGVERLEILRGPQSALYGGESLGGVVTLASLKGSGAPQSQLLLEGGSFDSFRAQASSSGSFENGLAYSLSISHETTNNDAQGTPELDYDQLTYALRLDYDVSENATMGVTFRGGHSEYHDTFGGENFTDYQLVTIYAQATLTDIWDSSLRLGAYTEAYDFGDPSTFATDAEKWSVSWENELGWKPGHTTAFGVIWENTDYAQDFSFPADRDQLGLYATHLWEVNESLTLTGGLRWEDYDDYGDELTWRATAAYHFESSDTTLRASFGTAYRTPSLIELNGGPFEAGNPNLDPEESVGWDIGVSQALGDDIALTLTWYENDVEHLIIDRFGAAPFNTNGKGKASGLEVGLEGQHDALGLGYGIAYTYLDHDLAGLPEHVIQADIHWNSAERLSLGAGLSYVGDRDLGGDPMNAYLVARLYGSFSLTENISLHARLENATDERYERANFGGTRVAAPRLGAYGGLTFVW